MSFSPLTSNQVTAFLPLNTWTEVNLISDTPTDSGVYIATTEEKEKKRTEDSEKILLQSSSYEKIKEFKSLEIVAIEINGKWYRGKLISFNEYQDDDTRIELIDIGSVHQTKLQNVFVLPYYFLYEPLALPIKFKNFTPQTKKLKIKPLLSESMLHVGVVTVDVNLNHFGLNNNQNGHKEVIKNNIKFDCDSSITSICNNVTNGHANIPSSYLSNGSRKGGYENQKISYDVPHFKNGDYCFITLFNGSSVYVVKAVKSITDNSFKMQDSYIISKTVESTDKDLKSCPRIGDIVKVFSEEKKTFYRGKIIKTLKDGLYYVFNIDLGSIEKVPPGCIYELTEELQNKPRLAVEIPIDDLLHNGCNQEIKNLFEKFIKEKKVFIMEFDERAENHLEHVKLKEENGSYLNLNYLINCLSLENPSEKTQELNRVNNTRNIHISSNEEHTTNGHQELISNTSNSENICDEYSVDNSKNIVDNVINKTKKHLIDDFEYIALANGDLCIISFFKNLKNIYVCKAVKNGLSYDSHNADIVVKTMSCSDKKIKRKPVIGDMVKVFSTEFDGFFRAEILSIENDGSFLVFYIDFGNTEIVQPSVIFELSNELLDKKTKLPVRVSIKVPPNSKETTEIDKLFKDLIDNVIVLSIEFNEKSTNSLENVTFKYLESGKSVNDDIIKLLPNVQIPIKNNDSCIITHVKDFDSIYVSKGHLPENSDFLNKVICSTDRKLKTNPLLDDIVKVLSPTFEDFYRAKILNVGNNGDFNVFYIDFGNTEVVQSNDIFELSDDFKIKPELAIKIGIKIPANFKLNEQIKEMLKNFEDDVVDLSIEFDETSEDGLQNCILKVISSGLNINEEIIKLFSTQSLCSVENLKAEIEKPVNSPEVCPIKPLKNREAVIVNYFDNFSAIFVYKVSDHDDFMSVNMKVANDETKKNMTNIKIGDIVKAPYEGDMYRALILDKKDQDHFCVSFIDFGNTETVHINQIFELSEELRKIPSYCIKIGMKKSLEIGQLEIVKDYFKNLDDALFIEYDENNPNGLHEVSLKKNNNVDIFDELCKIVDKPMNIKEESIKNTECNTENEILSKLSEIDRTSSIELKSGDTVFCCNFEDFDHIFLCVGSKNNTKPENFNVIVDSSKLKDLNVRKNPKFKDIVWVKFEGKMFRAEVLKKVDKMYTVFLLDIGKSIDVSADNIFEMLNNLKQIPGFATKVGLKRPQDFETSSVVKDYFHKLWYVEPVPLTMTCNEGNFNYLNEVNLKKLSDGHDIVDDLLKICGKFNDAPIKPKRIGEDKKSNGSNNQNYYLNGEHVQFLSGNNIDNIFIRSINLYESYKPILDRLNEEKNNLKVTTPKPQEIVAVFSLRYNGVYRAKIIGQNDDGSSRCALIDLGLIDFVKSKHIFALPSFASMPNVPSLTRKVTLANLTKTPNSSNIIVYLTSKVDKIFVLEYDKNAELWYKQVVLKNLQSGKSMNEEIRELLSVSSTDTSKSQQRRLERKIVVDEIKEIKMEKAHHPIKSGTNINIVHFESFSTIYVRDVTYDSLEMFSEFNKKMKKYYRHSSNLRIKELVHVGDKVCVNTTVNEVMHCRALVLEKIENKYNVFNVDYGNKESVHPNDIFELPEELGKFPYFAVHVQLQNMPQLTTENERRVINDYFKKKMICNNTQLILEFNEYNPKGLNDVIFRTEFTKKDIADDIRNLLNAPPLNIKTSQATENSNSSIATSYPSPYPARRHINASKN